ncbi:hypothetical protein BK727_12690 [Bacillus thuringiensis serovar roskildiensis]|uniref:Uncharacterized protein n=1 Tax=Bacillus thuringiensis serovar sooncheon TaxID=180891 RepID=A0A9Q5SDM0_BACTU|nr:hypothetical protein [Bacillus thuringiensis]MEB9661485.1 hypothetical protein [Bacillus cereus]ARV91229.1 hypothetical protein BJG91_00695 [Bacillus thuringiensis]OTW68922.1 hypothetical protein BK707_17880 [Bacillus thuringiensis serovar coreanensis]OTX42582.1 hypothetical protein BK724_24755 [Bacillus thuringiensis serovar sooncheon]OTX54530.1 hypothetical protein BK725_12630 [Bacillus thuringiensis serovar guiyangiensis]
MKVVSKEASVLLNHLEQVFENLEKEKKDKVNDEFRIIEEMSDGDMILKIYFVDEKSNVSKVPIILTLNQLQHFQNYLKSKQVIVKDVADNTLFTLFELGVCEPNTKIHLKAKDIINVLRAFGVKVQI